MKAQGRNQPQREQKEAEGDDAGNQITHVDMLPAATCHVQEPIAEALPARAENPRYSRAAEHPHANCA